MSARRRKSKLASPSEPRVAPTRQAFGCALGLMLLLFAMHLPRLGDAPLAGTEGHRAITAHQMLANASDWRDWAIPQLYGRPYLRKPPLFYWVLAGVERWTGRADEWTWRIPSVAGAALLAGAIGLFGCRWFGLLGGWVAGLSFGMLVAIWQQTRTADIDSLNTLASILAGLCLVELHAGPSAKLGAKAWRSRWALLGGIAFGAALLLKLHAGLPVLAGAIIATHRASRRNKTFSASISVIAIGLAIFAAWMAVAFAATRSRPELLDFSGLTEAIEKSVPLGWSRLYLSPLVGLKLFLYSLPISLALPIALSRGVRAKMDEPARGIAAACAWATLFAWLVCVLSGMVNERYGNVTLPLLCPVVGAIAASALKCLPAQQKQLRVILAGAAGALILGQLLMTKNAWRHEPGHAVLLGAVAAAVLLGGWGIWALLFKADWGGALGALLACLAIIVPFTASSVPERAARSGLAAAQRLGAIIPAGAPVVMGHVLRYQPELFYYANLNARAYAEELPSPAQLESAYPHGCWIVAFPQQPPSKEDKTPELEEAGLTAIREAFPGRLKNEAVVTSNKKNIIAVWFAGRE